MKKTLAGLCAILMALGAFLIFSPTSASADSDCEYGVPNSTTWAVIVHASCDLGDNRDIPIRCVADDGSTWAELEMYDSHMVGVTQYGVESSGIHWSETYQSYQGCHRNYGAALGWTDNDDGVDQVWVRDGTDLSCQKADGTWNNKWKATGWHDVVNNGFVYYCRVVADATPGV